MKCKQCGSAIGMVEDSGGTREGDEFKEIYKCNNGHTGVIRGTVGEEVAEWTFTGAIFNEHC